MRYWLSCKKFTCGFSVEDDIITRTASIIHKFKGQPLENLTNWVSKNFGEYELVEMNKEPQHEYWCETVGSCDLASLIYNMLSNNYKIDDITLNGQNFKVVAGKI
jgi:hypothetical protein